MSEMKRSRRTPSRRQVLKSGAGLALGSTLLGSFGGATPARAAGAEGFRTWVTSQPAPAPASAASRLTAIGPRAAPAAPGALRTVRTIIAVHASATSAPAVTPAALASAAAFQ